MRRLLLLLLLAAGLSLGASARAVVPPNSDAPESTPGLSLRVGPVEMHAGHKGDISVVLFLFGAFCALWAQNSGRSAWLWFFLGVFFNVLTVICLLIKNSNDNFERRTYSRTAREVRPVVPS